MALYVLEAFNTDSRFPWDIRYREYTHSKAKSVAFTKIPKIQFTDSGHGIVFSVHLHSGPKKPLIRELSDYVQVHLAKQLK